MREAAQDIREMRKYDQRKVLDAIEIHLTHQSMFLSKGRIEAMSQPFWSQYPLRVDEFRVYYDVNDEKRVVNVLRVLMKTTDQTPEETS
jgi:mRNA-degrading endonuclease RelE of RelBE toxin-antitoxin system